MSSDVVDIQTSRNRQNGWEAWVVLADGRTGYGMHAPLFSSGDRQTAIEKAIKNARKK